MSGALEIMVNQHGEADNFGEGEYLLIGIDLFILTGLFSFRGRVHSVHLLLQTIPQEHRPKGRVLNW